MQDIVMQMVDVEIKGPLIGLFESNLHGGSERVVDAIGEALGFNDNVETMRSSNRVWLSFDPMDMIEEHRQKEPIITSSGLQGTEGSSLIMKVWKGIKCSNIGFKKLVSSMDVDMKEVHHEVNEEEVFFSLSSISVLKGAPAAKRITMMQIKDGGGRKTMVLNLYDIGRTPPKVAKCMVSIIDK
jgi:hypothetical protein